jgi:tRNA-2-methylthio-N6-dimethylallyladenosine synthase
MTGKFFIHTFGCQMNKLDSELVAGSLVQAGFEPAATEEQADFILFNTCSVRQHAEDRVYSRIGALKRRKKRNPDLIIGVLGCMAQKEKERILRRFPYVDLVVGTRELLRLSELLKEIGADLPARSRKKQLLAVSEAVPFHFTRKIEKRPNKYQAFVSVMRGCNNFCSYCVVPFTRGPVVSRSSQDILDEVKSLVDDGCLEVTLLGQSITSYKSPTDEDLAMLLGLIAQKTQVKRLRFITSHPRDLRENVFHKMAEFEAICEYLHLPAQSGSDRILAAMNRGYTRNEYLNKTELARKIVPGLAIASDFIVGFPGETKEDFQATVALLREVRFQNSFIFKYSPRPLTAASRLKNDVPEEVKKNRHQILLDIQTEMSQAQNRLLLGQVLETLVEGSSKNNPAFFTGRTKTNQIVLFPADKSTIGKLVKVRVEDTTALTLRGFRVNSALALPIAQEREV